MPDIPTTNAWIILFLAGTAVSFLIGSIPFGWLFGKALGKDLREHGSGNIGATNAWRVLGAKLGLTAFILDFLKGFVPVYGVKYLVSDWPWSEVTGTLLVVCGLAAILGHNYTPWLGFKGGKGIATSAGILAAMVPWAFLAVITLWCGSVALTRIISLSSIVASVALPIAVAVFYPWEWVYLAFGLVAGISGVYRHRSNIKRLRAGTEPRIGEKKADEKEEVTNG